MSESETQLRYKLNAMLASWTRRFEGLQAKSFTADESNRLKTGAMVALDICSSDLREILDGEKASK